MSTEHPYAHLLRAIADGQQIERKNLINGQWQPSSSESVLQAITTSILFPEVFRIKPAAIRIGDVEVPAASLREEPGHRSRYFVPALSDPDHCFGSNWDGDLHDQHRLRSGLCFASAEEAKAVNKALLALLAPQGVTE